MGDVELLGARVTLRPLTPGDFAAWREVRWRCRDWLEPWEPLPPPGQTDVSDDEGAFARWCSLTDAERRRDEAYRLGIFVGVRFAGLISLGSVQRGSYQNAYIGYWIDRELAGRGYVPEAVVVMLRFAFEDLALHRVQISIMPSNHRSRRVVEKLGLRDEGVARGYLQIAGKWEDHIRYAITAEEWRDRRDELLTRWLGAP